MAEANSLLVATLAILLPLAARWWAGVPRRTRRLREQVEILASLPKDSAKREELRKHVDRMIDKEINDDRWDEVANVVAMLALGAGAWIVWDISREQGQPWTVLAIELTVVFGLLLAVGVAVAIHSRRHRERKPDQRPGRDRPCLSPRTGEPDPAEKRCQCRHLVRGPAPAYIPLTGLR